MVKVGVPFRWKYWGKKNITKIEEIENMLILGQFENYLQQISQLKLKKTKQKWTEFRRDVVASCGTLSQGQIPGIGNLALKPML